MNHDNKLEKISATDFTHSLLRLVIFLSINGNCVLAQTTSYDLRCWVPQCITHLYYKSVISYIMHIMYVWMYMNMNIYASINLQIKVTRSWDNISTFLQTSSLCNKKKV